jgi:tetratricopeptide (TPR) repeat protein
VTFVDILTHLNIVRRKRTGNLPSEIERLAVEFPEMQVLPVPTETVRLLEWMRGELENTAVTAAMVVLLETVADLPGLLSTANRIREEFREGCPFPVVLWVTDAVMESLMRFSPDFESWATTTEFQLSTDEIILRIDHLTEFWSDKKRIFLYEVAGLAAEIEAAQSDLAGNSKHLQPQVQANIAVLVGWLAQIKQDDDRAIDAFQQALALLPDDTQPSQRARILEELAYSSYLKAFVNRDRQDPVWQQARLRMQEYLDFCKVACHDRPVKAIVMLGEALRDLGCWEALEELAQQAIPTHQTNPIDLARDYGFLAEVALARSQWQAVGEFAQQALDVVSSSDVVRVAGQTEQYILIHSDGSLYLYLLAQAQMHKGDLSKAIENLEAARAEKSDEISLYCQILGSLRQLYMTQKEYFKAFEVKQERLSVEQQYGLRNLTTINCVTI